MIDFMAKRKNNNAISITDEAKAILDTFKRQSKMPYATIIEETLRWLSAQTDVVRAVIWGTLPESQAEEIVVRELEMARQRATFSNSDGANQDDAATANLQSPDVRAAVKDAMKRALSPPKEQKPSRSRSAHGRDDEK